MATDSPMSNFNRKNPYVIQAKQKYNELMEFYEKVSKYIIQYGSLSIATIILVIIIGIISKQYWVLITNGFFCVCWIFVTYKMIKNTIKDSINSDIDKMVTLESSEVINISIEYVQDLIYKLHECIGKVKSYLDWYRTFNIVTSVIMLNIFMRLVEEVFFNG